jgi:hypothetical protein
MINPKVCVQCGKPAWQGELCNLCIFEQKFGEFDKTEKIKKKRNKKGIVETNDNWR